MNLQNISVKVENVEEYSIGSLRALLTEAAVLLEKLANDGATGSIDLNSLPFAPGEYEQLRQLLGQGEVSAHIEAVGPSEVVETRYPGVWWVTHHNVEGDVIADTLEITTIPEIIKSQHEDIKMGLELLRVQLNDEVQQ
ncbi:MAG: hydrogenase expression/formation C-terminal domain-containing protein [Gallionellaceae bacterium]